MKFVEKKRKKSSSSIFRLKRSRSKDIQLHAIMLSLNRNTKKQTKPAIETTAFIENILKSSPKLDELFKRKSHRKFLIDFILQQSSATDTVVHFDNYNNQIEALNFYFLYTIMEHSCASNIMCLLNDNKMYYFTKYPIMEGEVLTNDHSISFENMSRENRRKILKETYGIKKCECLACAEKFPMHDELKVVNSEFVEKLEKTDVINMKNKSAKKLLSNNLKVQKEIFYAHFPSKDLSLINERNSIIFAKLIS